MGRWGDTRADEEIRGRGDRVITKHFKFGIADLLKNRSITSPSLTGRVGALPSAQYELIFTYPGNTI